MKEFNKKKTICLASNDVASVFKDFRRVFEEDGYKVISYVTVKPISKIIQQDKYDFWGTKYFPFFLNRKWNLARFRLINSIYVRLYTFFEKFSVDFQFKLISKQADIFIFFYDSIYSDQRDLEILKKLGKKIIFVFVGDDARWYYGMKQDFELHGLDVYSYGDNYDYSTKGLQQRLSKIRKAEKFADFIFSKREQSQLQIRPFFHYPMVIHMDDYLFSSFQREKTPIVVHAPSNREIKGTDFVLEAFRLLKSEGIDFEYVLVENMSHQEAKKVYQNADIVIDQLFIPGAGKLASEALAMGKVVLGRMAYGHYEQGFPINSCPIIDSSPHNIYDNLKAIILDVEKRRELSKQGREYADNFLNIKHLSSKMRSLINGEQMSTDFTPTFFLTTYTPESQEAESINKDWVDFVSGETWFKAQLQEQNNNWS